MTRKERNEIIGDTTMTMRLPSTWILFVPVVFFLSPYPTANPARLHAVQPSKGGFAPPKASDHYTGPSAPKTQTPLHYRRRPIFPLSWLAFCV